MNTEAKNPVGRPTLNDERTRRSAKSVSLPAYIWDWLAQQDGGRSENIEHALNEIFEISKPK